MGPSLLKPDRWQGERAAATPGAPPVLDQETVEALRTLGYLQ